MSNGIIESIKEKADYIYQRLRTQVTSHESIEGPKAHIFFVFGASVT